MLSKQVKIVGKVQGVFFRKSATKVAEALKLFGWIKNEKDGSVLALVQGNSFEINEFIEWCNKGPKGAEVYSVNCIQTNNAEVFTSFEILQ